MKVTGTKMRAVVAVAGASLLVAAPAGQARKRPSDPQQGKSAKQSKQAKTPFGLPCTDEHGVRFCQGNGKDERVPSFDKVPLDVDVTLPAKGSGPFPTLVMLHGYGGSKKDFETDSAKGNGSTTFHYNNLHYARLGLAVVNYTARGFGESCGNASDGSRDDPNCDNGYIHLADQRYEGRDTQYLVGLLVDQGFVNPRRIGVTGISYGGGQSIELALLNNRIRTPSGQFKPWRSPDGKRLSIAGAYPRWPWSDLVDALLPNGRFLDFKNPNRDDSRDPIGIEIASYVAGLYALGQNPNGYYCGNGPPGPTGACNNPDADINRWFVRIQEGEPYGSDARAIADEIFQHHQGFGLPLNHPAPLLLQSGWTDDLFPPRQSLRLYNELREHDRNADVSLQLGDLGHSRGANKPSTNRPLNDEGSDFFERLLLGEARRPKRGSVLAYGQTCPASAPADGPFYARSWDAIHPRTVSFSSSTSQTATSDPPDPLGPDYDPIAGGGDPCRQSDDSTQNDAGTAVYRGQASKGFRMIGLPTVKARISLTPSSPSDLAQLDSRLWDVGPDGKQVLISRGAYRFGKDTTSATFQLSGNAWCFPPGHTPKLQLLGTDRPYLRPTTFETSPFPYAIAVSSVKVELPAAQGKCGKAAGGAG